MPKLQLPQSNAILAEPAGSFFTALHMWRLSRMGRGDLSARRISPDVDSHALTAVPPPSLCFYLCLPESCLDLASPDREDLGVTVGRKIWGQSRARGDAYDLFLEKTARKGVWGPFVC